MEDTDSISKRKELEVSNTKSKEKKPRKRMKAVYSQIREQMEFYFSDSNLMRDRFMKKQITESKDGFINLDIFLNFNKIKSLTLDTNIIGTALKQSELLQISEDGKRVKRTKPVSSPKNIDDRTVYVECLPHNVDHEWVKKIFSTCGQVLYVSIPRYKSTGDPKGFAFIEFDSVEAANKACEDLNNPPAEAGDKPGKFPRTSKQLIHLQKSLGSKEDTIVPADKNLTESPTKSGKKKKRRRQTSDSSIDGGISETKQRKLEIEDKDKNTDLSQQEAVVFKSELNVTKSDESNNKDNKKKNKKRKKSKDEVQTSVTESETSDQLSVDESDKESRKRKKCDNEEGGAEPPSKISKDDKVCDNKENTESAANLPGDKNVTGTEEENKNKKKKKNRNHKSKHKEKDIPELRVISKKNWMDLKAEYLKLQKESMNMLKKTLNRIKEEKNHAEKDKSEKVAEDMPAEGKKTAERRQIEFKPDVIVGITSGRAMYRKEVKEDLGTGYQIAYVDIKEGEKSGYIRMQDSDSAKKLASAESGSYFFTLLQGQEEKDYWNKLESDRNSKFNTKSTGNKKKKGSQKLIERAQKISRENISRSHIKFDD